MAAEGSPGRSLIIVPNERPARYLAELHAKEKKAAVLPRMLPFSQVATIWSAAVSEAPYCQANPLDQVQVLGECVNELAENDPVLSAHFATMPMEQFLPWGRRLAGLIEEIFSQGIEPKDMGRLEDDVEPLAASLLQALGRISHLYRERLGSMKPARVTPGLESLIASQNTDRIPAYLRPGPDRPVYIAGFSSLNGAESRILHALWKAGATICLHSDPGLVTGSYHEAVQPQADWLRRWHAKAELVTETSENRPACSFFAAYDDHSQIQRMVSDLAAADQESPGASTAIILPDSGLLMPVLHHLPEREINISMGYPLRRAQLNSLLEDIFLIQFQRAPDGRYYWRSLLRLLNQPFLGILKAGEKREVRLRPVLRKLEHLIRRGEAKYVDLEEMRNELAALITPDEARLADRALFLFAKKPGLAGTSRELADALEQICNFLVEAGGRGWKRFPLDSEALSRLQNRVLPVLRNNLLRDEKFSLPVLQGMLTTLLELERIPFEADPLVGAQIMGLLETRLLHFDQLFILNASDDVLPGSAGQDPLLPDALRSLAGLPDNRTRQKVVEYNLQRLMASAKRVFFYWSEGASQSELMGGKKIRSRFVEQLIWQEEQKQGRILKTGEAPLEAARSVARVNRRLPAAIEGGAGIAAKMKTLLSGEISPTLLNSYIRCPAAFAMARLMCLNAPSEVNEGDDPPLVGICIHNTLANLLQPYKGQTVRLSDISFPELRRRFEGQLEEMAMATRLPVDSFLILERAGPIRLGKYLENQDEETLIRELEKPVEAKLKFNGREYRFRGIMDRIDLRDGQEVILDYKTGRLYPPVAGVWQNDEFFALLDAWLPDQPDAGQEGDALLAKLSELLPDLQLPVYMLVLEQASGRKPANAAYVDLSDSGREIPILKEEDDLDQMLAHSRSAVSFVLRHMESAGRFAPQPKNCEYCDFAAACRA